MYAGRNKDAETYLLKALELSTWRPERSTAMRYLARVTGNKEHWLLRACAEAPDRREPWVDLARFYYERKEWSSCLASCEKAIAITVKPLEYLCEAEAWGSLPDDLSSIACWNMGLKERAISHSEKALKLSPLDARLKGNYELMSGLLRKTAVDVVIPTKSNINGLRQALEVIRGSKSVGSIIVVADGQSAYDSALLVVTGPKETLLQVEEGSGIQVMWNLGMRSGSEHNHIMFLNDDVALEQNTIGTLCSQLNDDETIGLICPNYDGRAISGETQDTYGTCRGRYDGTGGIAGFCMTLRSDLRRRWRFDERMKWWYGDDDLVRWVSEVSGKRTVISARANCSSNSSWTVTNDPPKNFAQLVEMDRKVFCSKWGEDA
jgi:tetratricopeptide (TPR) repeat protein